MVQHLLHELFPELRKQSKTKVHWPQVVPKQFLGIFSISRLPVDCQESVSFWLINTVVEGRFYSPWFLFDAIVDFIRNKFPKNPTTFDSNNLFQRLQRDINDLKAKIEERRKNNDEIVKTRKKTERKLQRSHFDARGGSLIPCQDSRRMRIQEDWITKDEKSIGGDRVTNYDVLIKVKKTCFRSSRCRGEGRSCWADSWYHLGKVISSWLCFE